MNNKNPKPKGGKPIIMSNKSTNQNNNRAGGRGFVPGILTYGSLQGILFKSGSRVDRDLRQKAEAREPKSRNRRPQEVIYQWDQLENGFWMRLYTTIDTKSLVTRAQRTEKAKVRLTVRDAKSKQVVEFVSGSVEIFRDQTGWEQQVRTLLDRAYLFISRNRPICPLCKSQMEIRTGKRGEFWGCDQFPTCRGTRNIPEAFRPTATDGEAETFTSGGFGPAQNAGSVTEIQATAA